MDLSALENIIKNMVSDWTAETVVKLKKSLDRNNIGTFQGDLRNSIEAQWNFEKEELTSKIFFVYNVHGKFNDLKRLQFPNLPPIDVLQEFVLKRGIHNFKYVPAYQNVSADKMPTQDKIANRIAWGIAIKWKTDGKVVRKNRWQQLRTVLNTMPSFREKLTEKIAEFGLKSITEALEKINQSKS